MTLDLFSFVAPAAPAPTQRADAPGGSAPLGMRPYQAQAVELTLAEFAKGVRRTLVTAATGTGKTVGFAHLCDRMLEQEPGKRILIIVHRDELLRQAGSKIETIAGEQIGVEKAQEFARKSARVVVASIQSLIAVSRVTKRRRVEDRFNPADYSLCIIDEAHRYAGARKWRQAVEWLYKSNPDLRVVGFTATPKRGDDKAMGLLFQSVAFQYPIHTAIDDGWIVPIRQTSVVVEHLDLSKVRTTAGDLNEGDLARIVEYEKCLHEMAKPIIDLCGRRQTLIFCVTVAHADRLAEILNRHRPGSAAMVCGKTEEEERRDIFARFGRHEFQFLCNVGIATEGTDIPGVQVIVMARPTKSAGLFEQMLGRGLRPADCIAEQLNTLADATQRRALIEQSEKGYAEVIDFVGNTGKHKLVSVADVLGGNYSDEVKAKAAKQAKKEKGVPVDVAALLKATAEEISLEKTRKRQAEEREREARKGICADVEYRTETVDPFDYYGVRRPRLTDWDGMPRATNAQIEALRRRGFEIDWSRLTKGEAGRMLSACAAKMSPKQLKVLVRCGWSEGELTGVNGREASRLIDIAKNNGWHRPDGEPVTAPAAVAEPSGEYW